MSQTPIRESAQKYFRQKDRTSLLHGCREWDIWDSSISVSQEGTETLKGEYSPAELFVHLNGLAGTYSITLTDEAGKEVYAKEVLTDNVLALSTDLLTYAPGTYTLTVENEYEKFVTILNLTTDIASTPAPTQDKDALYDLSGRKLEHAPQKGIYIQNGKKVLVK